MTLLTLHSGALRATQLLITTQPSDGAAGANITIAIRTAGPGGAAVPVEGVEFTLELNDTDSVGASLAGTVTGTTDANGEATLNAWSIAKFGRFTVTVSDDSGGLASATSDSFINAFDYDNTFGALLASDGEWWRASLGVTKDGSDRVSAWAGQKGRQTLAAATNQPLFVAESNVGGQPAIRTAGSPERMLTGAWALAFPFTYLIAGYAASANGTVGIELGNNNGIYPSSGPRMWAGASEQLASAANGQGSHTYIARYDSDPDAYGWFDGAVGSGVDGNVGTREQTSFWIGRGLGNSTPADYAEIACLPGVPTAAQLNEWLRAVKAPTSQGGMGYGIDYTAIT